MDQEIVIERCQVQFGIPCTVRNTYKDFQRNAALTRYQKYMNRLGVYVIQSSTARGIV